jgi:hypothetical protein
VARRVTPAAGTRPGLRPGHRPGADRVRARRRVRVQTRERGRGRGRGPEPLAPAAHPPRTATPRLTAGQ